MTLIDYEKSNVKIRRFEEQDAETVSKLITRNFMEVNSKDYGIEAMKELSKTHDAAWVSQVASYAHMYVFKWGKKVEGSEFWK